MVQVRGGGTYELYINYEKRNFSSVVTTGEFYWFGEQLKPGRGPK